MGVIRKMGVGCERWHQTIFVAQILKDHAVAISMHGPGRSREAG